jgi:hypothetical protein
MERLLYLLAAAVVAMLTLVPSAFAATQGTVPAPAGTQTQPLPLPMIRLSRSLPPVVRALAVRLLSCPLLQRCFWAQGS